MSTMTTMQLKTEDELRAAARRRVGMKMGFYTHALVFALVNIGLYFINSLSMGMGGGVRWHQYPLLGWGLGLAIHGIATFIALQGMGVRERMVEREIEALRRRQQ